LIGRLTGQLIEKRPPTVVVEVHGVGYEVDVPMSTFFSLPATGDTVTLHTHLLVREDAHILYGFATLRTPGVPTTAEDQCRSADRASSVLSGMSVSELHQAVAAHYCARLTDRDGKKTANACCSSCATNSPSWRVAVPGGDAQIRADALNALLALGYSDKEATQALGVSHRRRRQEAIRHSNCSQKLDRRAGATVFPGRRERQYTRPRSDDFPRWAKTGANFRRACSDRSTLRCAR
jgi:Holliday junction DNA helicase RuvA